MNNCSPNITTGVEATYIAISIPTFTFGLFGNIAVLTILYCQQREALTYMMVYIGNMAFADSLVLFSLPFKMYSLKNSWQLGMHLCLVVNSAYFVNMYVSIFTVTAISVVRYIAIKYPFRAKEIVSPRKAVAVCVSIWLVVCSLSAIFHFVDTPMSNSSDFKCFQKIENKPFPPSFIAVLVTVGYLLPLLIMGFCSIRIIMSLSKKTHEHWSKKKAQCIRIIMTNLIVFVVCFTPFHFGFLLKFLVQKYTRGCPLLETVHNFVHVTIAISHANCCLDVFTYYFLTSDFWKTLSASISARKLCCLKKNSVI